MSGNRKTIGPTLEPDAVVGPTPPPRLVDGPSLPPKRKIIGPTVEFDKEEIQAHYEGPTLPGAAGRISPQPADGPVPPPKRKIIGPILSDEDDPVIEGPPPPPNFTKPTETPPTKKRDNSHLVSDVLVGPPRPGSAPIPDLDDDDQDKKLRASEWDNVKRTTQTKTTKREEWMTELPPERSSNAAALITNRQFSKKDNATTRGDTSLWTASPAEREQKKQKMAEGKTAENLKEISSNHFANQKDEANLKVMEHHNKKYRAKTLVEEHQETLKKKQAETKPEEEPLWKSFDRTTDLGQRVSDPRTAAKIIQNAQTLNSRFGSSSSKRFL